MENVSGKNDVFRWKRRQTGDSDVGDRPPHGLRTDVRGLRFTGDA